MTPLPWFSDRDSPLLQRGHCRFHSFRLQARLVFGDGGEDVDCELVRLRKIGRHKIKSALQEPGDHFDASGQTIKAGDDEGRANDATEAKRFPKLRAVILPTADRLRKFRHKCPSEPEM